MEIPDLGIDVTPANLLVYAQQSRMKALLTGEELSESTERLLAQVAKTALDQERILAEESSAKAQGELASALAGMVSKLQNPYHGGEANPNRIVELSGDDLPELAIIEGETSQELATESYEEFMSRTDPNSA